MTSVAFRNPPWAGAAALFILGLGTAILAGSLSEPETTALTHRHLSPPTGLAWAGDGPWLLPGRPVRRRLDGESFHAFKIFLQAGQAADLIVEHEGIDVVATLWAPERRLLLLAETPGGERGEKRLFTVAATSGSHAVIVQAAGGEGPGGHYRVRLRSVRLASAQDRRRAEAARLFSAGELRLYRTPRYRSALDLYERALALWESLGDRAAVTETLHRIGVAHAALNSSADRAEALSIWREKVLPCWQGTPREPLLLNQMGEVSSDVELHRQALERAHHWNDRIQEMRALNQMIPLLQRQGQTQKALNVLQSALALAGPSARERARLYATAGELYRTTGSYERSVQLCRDALDLLEAGEGQPVALAAMNSLALSLFPLGEHDEALELLAEAKKLAEQTGGPEWMASVLNSLGTVHVDRYERTPDAWRDPGDLELADRYLGEALALARTVDSGSQEANALAYLGRTRDLQGREAEGIELCTRAREKYGELRYDFGVAGTSFCLARAYQDIGRASEARTLMERSLEIIEGLRSAPLSRSLRAKFLGARRRFYQFYATLLMELAERHPGADFKVLALEQSERFRGRTLLEELAARDRLTDDPEDPLAGQRQALEEELRQAAPESRLLWGQASLSRTPGEQAKVRDLIVRLESLGSGKAAEPAVAERARLLSLEEIQREVVDDETLFLEYLLGEDRSFLWLVGRDSFKVHELPGEREIAELAIAFAELTAEARDAEGIALARAAGEELAAVILEPVADLLGDRRLLVSPDGALFRVPFEALPALNPCSAKTRWNGSGEPPLLVCNEVVYTPSASVLAEIRDAAASRPARERRLAALGDPVFGPADPRVRGHGTPGATAGPVERALYVYGFGRLERLEESGTEVATITAGLPMDQVLMATGFAATRELAMSPELARYGIVHFATHALALPNFPELSGLVFSQLDRDGRWLDGFLPLYEVYGLNLPVDLVVLSACRTGGGEEVRGEGVVSLARAFLSAGASRVIVSLWDVDDEATSALMRRFYENVFERHRPFSAALREARLAMLDDPEHPEWAAPAYWAPFVLQGEWR